MINIPKKWRELQKETRLNIPTKKFGIREGDLKNIRKIIDPKKRLIEAARLQYNKFNDIHSYLTAWIAGYGSDVIIRQKFGSTKKLLDLFLKKTKIPKQITPSWSDIKRRVKIPKKMTVGLAEETGIHIGDGNMYASKNNKYGKEYSYAISGDLADEYNYHNNYIKNLIKKLYNLNTTILKRPLKNNIDSRIKSKAIVEFKNKILKLPIGNKKNIEIPKEIMKNKEFSRKCAVGVIDTDFSITKHLAITGKLNNLLVVDQLARIFNENNISFKVKKYINYGRFYIKKEGATKIITKWRLHNLKHISKYLLLKKFNKFISKSNTYERMQVINGKMDIEELEKVCEKRKKLKNN